MLFSSFSGDCRKSVGKGRKSVGKRRKNSLGRQIRPDPAPRGRKVEQREGKCREMMKSVGKGGKV